MNHVSDSISVVDVAREPGRTCVRTILPATEPRDIVFAGGRLVRNDGAPRPENASGPAVARSTRRPPRRSPAGEVRSCSTRRRTRWSLGGTPVAVLELFGDTPRALAVSPGWRHGLRGVRRSGNRRQTVQRAGGLRRRRKRTPLPGGDATVPGMRAVPAPDRLPTARPRRRTASSSSTTPRAERGSTPWDAIGGTPSFLLPDRDVFAIDATASPRSCAARGRAWHGALQPDRQSADRDGLRQQHGRQQPAAVRRHPGGLLRGLDGPRHQHEARITVIDGRSRVAPRPPESPPRTVRREPLGRPKRRGVWRRRSAWPRRRHALGRRVRVGPRSRVLDCPRARGRQPHAERDGARAVSGGGPSGLALRGTALRTHPLRQRGSVVDTAAGRRIAHLPLQRPRAAVGRDGRTLPLRRHGDLGHGEASCARSARVR